MLASAATLGRHFDWHLLESATNLDTAKVAEALELGVRSQLLTVEGDSFRFRHALTSEAVLNAVVPPRRVAIANAALQALHDPRPAVLGTADRELAAGLAERETQPDTPVHFSRKSESTQLQRAPWRVQPSHSTVQRS